ncbi:Glyoxylate reductase [Fulvia fulva]|uniref:Glyoxylate reductase n=1 Tax=Passalora fulva TaxID=5499 RepID=A0A9Q8LAG9_PASFU|nr:Glyoxylate reductase [Fulvia fulva]KAK4631707.1 Glyoxylate reductase [Fulvia fulva]KAK4632719.1 Glyoxylate reductase [Fulvia fulva]UJO13804.1 Glyoxylate reductase [Fulvia fulva]WPV11566.1 Glyoxylate reductase [Fulvia fulva]WPV26765.1 Glyoxylate reductase [Fulvia fulva]
MPTTRPDILLIQSPIQAIDHTRRTLLAQNFNLINYDCTTLSDFRQRMHPGRPYASLQAILRLGWHKVGAYADLKPFIQHGHGSAFPPSLKILCSSGHGYDAADTFALAKRGIWYCNTPNACTEAVANSALWLVLDTFRYLTFAQNSARHDWSLSWDFGMEAEDPTGNSLGIAGLGDIGMAIARKSEVAYGMRVHYCGPRRKVENEKGLEYGARYYETVEDMIPAVDCLVLAAPFTRETHHMLGRDQFALAKPSVSGS